MPSKISTLTPVLQADLDDTAALEVTNRLGQTRKSTIAQLRTAIVAGVLVAAHLTSPVIDSGGLTITSGTLGAQAVTATALTVTPGATSLASLNVTGVSTLHGITVDADIIPSSTDIASAGTTGRRWFQVYASRYFGGASGSQFDGTVTISTGGLTVSAGTTAVQALTATTTGANSLILNRTDAGATTVLVVQQNGANRGFIGTDGTNLSIYGPTNLSGFTIANSGLVAFTAGATFGAGITATGFKTLNGSVPAVLNNTATTLFSVPDAPGLYIVTASVTGGNSFQGYAVISTNGSGVANVVASGQPSVNFNFSVSTLAVQVTQTSGSTQTVNWSYLKIA